MKPNYEVCAMLVIVFFSMTVALMLGFTVFGPPEKFGGIPDEQVAYVYAQTRYPGNGQPSDDSHFAPRTH